jgi:hypothetical protein
MHNVHKGYRMVVAALIHHLMAQTGLKKTNVQQYPCGKIWLKRTIVVNGQNIVAAAHHGIK